jgi:ATP-dependent helicase HrpA
VSTNVAETSLTIPRIRYVIDSGLARISRYNPRTRTKRLPVEPVAQSSANQRAGRAGRVQDGVCVRLYAQEDFAARPQFMQPEIQRANLAEVILRMKAFRLGDVETFPFLHPPSNAAIQAGYNLLHELGALNDEHEMTPLGHELARLPIDPTLGRMMMQAEREGVLPEVLVIAAGLSIPDPRERPEDAKETAAAAHRAMADPESDFLTLLRIWRAMPPAESRNALRRWAKGNFYNASRLREWRDLHRQLADAMDVKPSLPDRDPHYSAIHRSVLTGLLGHVALREERNTYKATGNRLTTIFPGSGLFARGKKPAAGARKAPEEKGKAPSQPQWIMAAEIVETSALYARTNASILPEWIAELGAHLCSLRYGDPHWDAKAGRVLATERTLLGGLEVARKLIDFGRIEPEEATEIFIRGALIEAANPIQLRFFTENQKLRVKMETALTRLRNHRALVLDEMLYRFYAARIDGVSSTHDLQRFVKSRLAIEPDFLCATEADLLGDSGADYDRDAFPEQIRARRRDGECTAARRARAHGGAVAMDGARHARRSNQHAAAGAAKDDPQNIAAAGAESAGDFRGI